MTEYCPSYKPLRNQRIPQPTKPTNQPTKQTTDHSTNQASNTAKRVTAPKAPKTATTAHPIATVSHTTMGKQLT